MNLPIDKNKQALYFKEHPFLNGRFILRPFNETDAKGLFELDSIEEVHTYLGTKPVKRLEESQKVLDFLLRQYDENGIGRLAIEEVSTGKFVGWSGLKYELELRKDNPYFDLGYRLKPEYWKMKIGSSSARISVNLAFQSLGLNKLGAVAMPGNLGSNTIIKNLGFQQGEDFEFEGDHLFWYELTKQQYFKGLHV